MSVVTEKLKLQIDKEGNLENEHYSKLENEFKKVQNDIEKFMQDFSTMHNDFGQFKNKQIEDTAEQAAKFQLEQLTTKIESKDLNEKLTSVMKDLKEL